MRVWIYISTKYYCTTYTVQFLLVMFIIVGHCEMIVRICGTTLRQCHVWSHLIELVVCNYIKQCAVANWLASFTFYTNFCVSHYAHKLRSSSIEDRSTWIVNITTHCSIGVRKCDSLEVYAFLNNCKWCSVIIYSSAIVIVLYII